MNTHTKTAMIPLRCISIEQVEGKTDNLTKCGCQTWIAAYSALNKIRDKAPKDGSYYKTDVVVTWTDGMEVRVREDVTGDGSYNPNLAERVRSLWLFYGALQKPDHMTEERYAAFTADKTRRDAAIQCLKKYSLEDTEGVTLTSLVVSKAEIKRAIDQVATLLKRVEDPDFRHGIDPAKLRTMAMELRKSLAALIRVEDVT